MTRIWKQNKNLLKLSLQKHMIETIKLRVQVLDLYHVGRLGSGNKR